MQRHAKAPAGPDFSSTQPLVGNTTGKDNYVILDTQGEGQYVGCFLFVDSAPGGWWGEGDEMMYIDGDKMPTIIGTGTEDYFCNAWGFSGTSNFPYYGLPFLEKQPDGWTQTTAYRLHLPDPVRFKKKPSGNYRTRLEREGRKRLFEHRLLVSASAGRTAIAFARRDGKSTPGTSVANAGKTDIAKH